MIGDGIPLRELPGWAEDDLEAAFAAFRNSFEELKSIKLEDWSIIGLEALKNNNSK